MVSRAILSNWKTVNSKPPTISIWIVACTFSDNLSRNGCIFKGIIKPGGAYSQEFLVGVCRPVLQILTLFQTKKCHFPNPFSDQASKLHTRFQTWAEIMSSLLRLERKQKKFFKSISNSHISLSFLLVWNWSDKYVHTVPSFPRKLYPISDQNGTKNRPDGAAHSYIDI